MNVGSHRCVPDRGEKQNKCREQFKDGSERGLAPVSRVRGDYAFPGRDRRSVVAGEGLGSSRGRGPPTAWVEPGQEGPAGGGCLRVTRST